MVRIDCLDPYQVTDYVASVVLNVFAEQVSRLPRIVVELVDTPALGAGSARSAGSSPAYPTKAAHTCLSWSVVGKHLSGPKMVSVEGVLDTFHANRIVATQPSGLKTRNLPL